MSLHFSANQFEDAYAPQRLSNWQIPKSFPERPRIRHGATRTIADDAGHFSGHSGRKQNNHHLRFQSAPLPASTKPNQLFISGSAVAAAKPARVAKVNLGQRTTQPTEPTAGVSRSSKSLHQLQPDEEEGDGGEVERALSQESEPISIRQLVLSSSLPDHPRKAALVLAARQKNHRPLPDLILESRDALIPRNWNQPPATAITVETTKAKGPTSCTKRTVVRLLPDGETPTTPLTGRQPNVMELAIKWDVTSPPSSASGTRQPQHHHPVEKTLEWLYDAPVIHRSTARKPEGKRINPKPLERSVSLSLQRPEATGADSGTSSRSSVSARVHPVDGPKTSGDSADDPESGYSSPRSSADGDNTTHHKPSSAVALTGLDDQVKTTYRSAAPTACSSAQATPPKNHFLVSTSAFVGTDMDGRKDSILLPEYPLQRRSPVQHPAQQSRPLPVETQGKKHQPTMKYHRSASQVEHSPHKEQQRQRHSSGQYTAANDSRRRMEEDEDDRHYSHHHHCDRDSGIGDPHDRVEDEEEECDDREDYENHRQQQQPPQRGQLRRSRSRPCVACIHSPLPQGRQQQQQQKSAYKPAMRAGIPNLKSHVDLEKVIQRRQSYRAPKPAPLSSHARYIRGTLAPPLSAGIGNEPIVDYPDFKRLDSTYRLSYGVHPTLPQRRRPKTLTALLNEKCSRQWK